MAFPGLPNCFVYSTGKTLHA